MIKQKNDLFGRKKEKVLAHAKKGGEKGEKHREDAILHTRCDPIFAFCYFHGQACVAEIDPRECIPRIVNFASYASVVGDVDGSERWGVTYRHERRWCYIWQRSAQQATKRGP